MSKGLSSFLKRADQSKNQSLKNMEVKYKRTGSIKSIHTIAKKRLGFDSFDLMVNNPMFETLRNGPEFKAIVKKVQEEKAAIRMQIKEMENTGKLDL